MFGLSQDLIPGQILGKIGYINQCLRIIDPDATHSEIRKDYKSEIEWHEKPLTELYAACKTGQCGDYDELGKKSLVLQELSRLVTLIQPQVMSTQMLDAVYQELKKQADLWSSAYHVQLNRLEKLLLTTSRPSLNRSFLNALNAQLKLFISKNGFDPANSELQQLINLAAQVQEMINNNNGNNFELIKKFICTLPYSVNELISKEEEQLFLSQFINEFISKIHFQPLKERLLTLLPMLSMDQALFEELNKFATVDAQIHALSSTKLGKHQLSLAEIEWLFPINIAISLELAMEYTTNQGYLLLLSKAYPHSKDALDNLRMKSTVEINETLEDPELLHSIIAAEVLSQTKDKDWLTQEATKQLLEALRKELNKPHAIQPNLSLIQLHLFLQGHIERVGKEIEKRKLMIDALGFAIPTFKKVEQVMCDYAAKSPQAHPEIIQKFYFSIKAAKEQFLCQKHPVEELSFQSCCADMAKEPRASKKQMPNTLKLIEEINEKDVIQFFKACCTAGREAAKELQNTRSITTIIVDTLKMLVNWAIRILSCGKTPQFFKPQTTAVDNLASAVGELKEIFEETLDHLNLDLELEHSVSNSL